MSLGSNKGFYKQYARSSYIKKINPEFEGIAQKYYNEKKEHEKMHRIKTKLDQEIAYIERIEQNALNSLYKKKKQLEFTKEVNNRLHNDIRRREWLHDFKADTIKNNKQKASILKCDSERKALDSRFYLSENKRSIANFGKQQNARIKQAKNLKEAKEWDANRSRVSVIYQFKKDVKDHTNQFFKKRNASSMSNYNSRIQSYKKFSVYDSSKIQELQGMKKTLNERYQHSQNECDQLTKEIERVKKESKLENGLMRSRLRSGSSQALSVRSTSSLSQNSQIRNVKIQKKSSLIQVGH